MLTDVHDDEATGIGQRPHDVGGRIGAGLGQAQRVGNCDRDLVSLPDHAQVDDEEGQAATAATPGDFQRQPGLADSARAGHHGQPGAGNRLLGSAASRVRPTNRSIRAGGLVDPRTTVAKIDRLITS